MKKRIIILFIIIIIIINGCNIFNKDDKKENKEVDSSVIVDINESESKEETQSKETSNENEKNDELKKNEEESQGKEQNTIEDKLKNINYYIEDLKSDYISYIEENKGMNLENIVLDVNIGLDEDFYEDIKIADNPHQLDVLCNKYSALPSEFEPKGLVKIEEKYHINDGKEYIIDKRLKTAYLEMYKDALNSQIDLEIASAYRSKDYQKDLYNRYKSSHGKEKADTFSARPRHSEHETGLAIDFYPISNSFEDTEEFDWLMENAHNYGFILRYPKNKVDITGYKYEPWHYRFVGKEIATKIKVQDLTYDEYYAKYILPKIK